MDCLFFTMLDSWRPPKYNCETSLLLPSLPLPPLHPSFSLPPPSLPPGPTPKPFTGSGGALTDRQTDGRTELLYQYRASAAVC